MALLARMMLICVLGVAAPAAAQQTTGNIIGTVVDSQGAAIAGATVSARNADTGFRRETASDDNGIYRLLALPVGRYSVVAERQGMARFDRDSITVNIARTTDLDIVLRLATLTDTVVVTAQLPLVSTTASSLGQIVDAGRIERLPLNGRQFASLAATVPGVGLGLHSDPTKLGQLTPQISGGNGRNISFVVDGALNNDDTVGGLLLLFPLESIQEFNVITQRAGAEFGRNGAGVLNVVTRSGTNQLRGSWFTLMRDDALNARTQSEKNANIAKQAYQRLQFGGSVGGPLVLDRVHYFAAYERTQQDTRQVVDTFGLFPGEEGVFDVAFRQNLFTGKLTVTPTTSQYVALRFARDSNSQPAGAGLRNARSSWATSSNTYNSFNVNHNWVLGSRLNELVFQHLRFVNDIPQVNNLPSFFFPGSVRAGGSPIAPQGTRQTTWELRDALSWSLTGWGLGHQLKAGFSWLHEPTLMVTFQQGTNGIFTIGSLNVNGPVLDVLVINEANTQLNFPLDSYGLFVQDDWFVNSRLTLNLGLRWDYTDGLPIEQATNPNFIALQAAGAAGRFNNTILSDFGPETRGDFDNIQPRLGFVYDLRGNGRNLIRGGWGIYTDFAYTNANVLTAAIDAQGGGGPVFSATAPTGLVRADGQLFRASDPLSTIAHLNVIPPGFRSLAGEIVSPRLEQPYTRQLSLGWARELSPTTAVTADYVKVQGRDLNMRIRPNVVVNGVRFLAGIPISPNSVTRIRTAVSRGRSEYDALIVGVRRRLSAGIDFSLGYTLAKATSDVGTSSDEIVQNLIQDITQPLSDVQLGPSTRTDARHQVTFSAIYEAPYGIVVAPVFTYRSTLPTHTFEGRDLNADGQLNDRTPLAYRFTGLSGTTATFEEMGACETVNCSRRASFSQLNLRVSRSFALPGAARIEAIAEVFNLFNAKNPSLPLTSQRVATATGAPLASFMQPEAYAGDIGQPEQRVGQIGFRFTF
jgi:outer membrane receptor protein involved in Fe transport